MTEPLQKTSDVVRVSIALPWRCRWGFHAWSVWSAPEPGRWESALLGKSGDVMVQERRCLRCALTTLRQVQ